MTRQESDDRVVPQGRRKAVPTRVASRREGGKAITVEQQGGQLELLLGTAERAKAQALASDGGAARGGPRAVTHAAPKPRSKGGTTQPVTMEAVAQELRLAFHKVAANRGAAGPDRQSIDDVREHLGELLPRLSTALLDGSYRAGEIRRVWIPKAGGGERGLGIPNVVDRVVQEAVRRVLEPVYEPTFREESHGFRPGRSCQTAIAAARKHVEEGHEWVVDLDLEKFFDRVNHQRLMARLALRVEDRRVLALIHGMLTAKVVMPDGVLVSTEEGVPQGGPLSPLLSNVVLDELDEELVRRGHRFVRYADDCNIYVRSERAGERVMASVVRFIESRLRLKVNAAKSAVARPEERHFLGFRLVVDPLDGKVEVLLSKRTKDRIDEQVRQLTPRTWGRSLTACITAINAYLLGWIGFFGTCTEGVLRTLQTLDAHIRRRLRALQLKHWKTRRTIALRLIRLGVKAKTAWNCVQSGRRSLWSLSHSPAVDRGLRNAHWAARGLESLAGRWRQHPARLIVAPAAQLTLTLG
jgi:RNA-directed DNA polymerase